MRLGDVRVSRTLMHPSHTAPGLSCAGAVLVLRWLSQSATSSESGNGWLVQRGALLEIGAHAPVILWEAPLYAGFAPGPAARGIVERLPVRWATA